ncbi:MAG: hypothetical protein KBD01_12815 [Acidobacteria bacterium]|nr:hypothetical protein [Acidobacteriota bacterium]
MTIHPLRRSFVPAVALFAIAATLVLLAACTALKGNLPQEPGLHPRLTRFTYLEEGKLVSFAVDTAATRKREDAPYVPFGIAVANMSLPRLTLTRESFTLVDDKGQRSSLATIQQARELAGLTVYDLRLSQDFFDVMFTRFSAWPFTQAVFFPVQSPAGGDPEISRRGIVRERVELPVHSWTRDVIYFPHPEGQLMGRRYEMWLDTEELEDPIFVKFEVK